MADADNALLTVVARMYYLDGLGQSEIAQIHGVSRSKVSRMITEARRRGIVRISVDEYDPRDRELENALKTRFNLEHAIVVRNMGGAESSARHTVGYFAAASVAEWIARQQTVGVAGGRTLGALVQAMEMRSEGRGPQVVQLMGMIGASPSSIDASELCRTLATRFHGVVRTISAPAFVEGPRVRDLFLSHNQIRAVWETFSSIDIALVGVGTLDESVFVEREVLDSDELDQLRASGAVGEICGRFFDADGRECATPYRDRVVSIGLDALRESKEVIAVTTGSQRRAAVRAALRGGIVHSLIIDDAGATAILGDA